MAVYFIYSPVVCQIENIASCEHNFARSYGQSVQQAPASPPILALLSRSSETGGWVENRNDYAASGSKKRVKRIYLNFEYFSFLHIRERRWRGETEETVSPNFKKILWFHI